MRNVQSISILVLILTFPCAAIAATMNIYTADNGHNLSPELPEQYDYQVLAGGNLYLDYSVFSNDQNLFGASTSPFNFLFDANDSLYIYGYSNTPDLPGTFDGSIFYHIDATVIQTGDILLFSHSPISNAVFKTQKSIYIGNYASYSNVPIPASFIFLGIGLILLRLGIAGKKVIG